MKLRRGELEWREVERQILALDLNDSHYLRINRTGRELWTALLEGATRVELAERLMKKYGIDPERAESDVSTFVDQLDERGLIVREPGSG